MAGPSPVVRAARIATTLQMAYPTIPTTATLLCRRNDEALSQEAVPHAARGSRALPHGDGKRACHGVVEGEAKSRIRRSSFAPRRFPLDAPRTTHARPLGGRPRPCPLGLGPLGLGPLGMAPRGLPPPSGVQQEALLGRERDGLPHVRRVPNGSGHGVLLRGP